jgi:hypothetical protein
MSAVMDAVAVATAGLPRQYPLGSVPSSPPYPYGSHSASLGRGDVPTLDGFEGIRWGQIVSQHFARSASAALDAAEAFRSSIVGVSLDIAGYDTTPCQQPFDPAVVRDPDDNGVIGVTQTFTFTATKEA